MTVSRINSTKSRINSRQNLGLIRFILNVYVPVPFKTSLLSLSKCPGFLSLFFLSLFPFPSFFSLFSLFFSFFPRPPRTLFSFFSLFLFLILNLSLKSSLLEFFLVNKGFLPCFPVFFFIEKEKKEGNGCNTQMLTELNYRHRNSHRNKIPVAVSSSSLFSFFLFWPSKMGRRRRMI